MAAAVMLINLNTVSESCCRYYEKTSLGGDMCLRSEIYWVPQTLLVRKGYPLAAWFECEEGIAARTL